MAKKTPPHPFYPKWTTAKFWGFIRSGLRSKWTRWPPRYEALNEAKREYKGENNRQKWEYKCASCKKWFQAKQVEVDHINPVGTLKDYKDLEVFVKRLFAPKEELRVVCKKCHNEITKKERDNERQKSKETS